MHLTGGAALATVAWPLLQACGGGNDSGAAGSQGGVHLVEMGGPEGELAFFPDRLVIRPGETVRWQVRSAGHSATAYHQANSQRYRGRVPEEAEPWNSDVLYDEGDSFEHTFTVEGIYHYYCIPHEGSGMVGAIVVGEALPGPASQPPQTDIPEAAKGKLEELMAWARGLE